MTARHHAQPARLYPLPYVLRLVAAGARHDHDEIDRITDELFKLGLCRARTDRGRLESVAAFAGAFAGAIEQGVA